MSRFVPGIELARGFYEEAVRPILDESFPRLRYYAALIGPGSEVLRYDNERSTDHHWGPRVLLFLESGDVVSVGDAIVQMLAARLPVTFRGWSTNFGPPDAIGVRLLHAAESGPLRR